MHKLFLSIAIILLASGCKKELEELNNSVEVETGTYIGVLNNQRTGQSLTQFKISLVKIGDKLYKASQIDSGNLPDIIMEDKIHNYPFAMFRISNQTNQGLTFAGAGQIGNGYDGQFNMTMKSIFFHIKYSDNSYLSFDGSKQ